MPAPRKKILMVDDSSTALLWEHLLLQDEPYDLLTAMDGAEGVRVAERELPDLILMDVMMPRMDGLEACRAVRANPALERIPVIMVTTRSELATMEAGYECGCNDFVTKPIDPAELLEKVRQLLDSGNAAGAQCS